jgi:hypothetical protein
MKKTIITIVGAAAFAVTLTQTARAIPITGNMGFSGAVQLDSGNVQNATEAVAWYNTVVNGTSGSFTSIANGTAVALVAPWFFNSGPLNNFWVVGGYTFDLLSSKIYSQDGSFLNIVLAGTVYNKAFDPTAFNGTFQVANPPANGVTVFTERLSFSSVPDGGSTVLMLGLACTGMFLIKRKLGTPAALVS